MSVHKRIEYVVVSPISSLIRWRLGKTYESDGPGMGTTSRPAFRVSRYPFRKTLPGSNIESAGCGKGCRVTLDPDFVKIPVVVGASPVGRDQRAF